MVRRALESLYKGKCTIFQYEQVTDPITKRTTLEEVQLCADQPCRLSYSNATSANDTDTIAEIKQVIKLFIAPELEIKAGSKIIVTQNGVTKSYTASGAAAVYTNHQEIILNIEENKA